MIKCPNCQFLIKDTFLLEKRSNPQNRYFHGVVIPILAEHLGYSQIEIKDILKMRFLQETRVIDTKHGMVEIDYIKPTSSLDTLSFEMFLESIRSWASYDLGVEIPLPNEDYSSLNKDT